MRIFSTTVAVIMSFAIFIASSRILIGAHNYEINTPLEAYTYESYSETAQDESNSTDSSMNASYSDPTIVTVPLIDYSDHYTADDIRLVANVIYGESRGVPSTMERAAVAWTVLNRVDAWGQSIETVITTPHQFCGYFADDIYYERALTLAEDVLRRWSQEKYGELDVGRVLPKEYLYFYGDSLHNAFRIEYNGHDTWDWSLPNPYAD